MKNKIRTLVAFMLICMLAVANNCVFAGAKAEDLQKTDSKDTYRERLVTFSDVTDDGKNWVVDVNISKDISKYFEESEGIKYYVQPIGDDGKLSGEEYLGYMDEYLKIYSRVPQTFVYHTISKDDINVLLSEVSVGLKNNILKIVDSAYEDGNVTANGTLYALETLSGYSRALANQFIMANQSESVTENSVKSLYKTLDTSSLKIEVDKKIAPNGFVVVFDYNADLKTLEESNWSNVLKFVGLDKENRFEKLLQKQDNVNEQLAKQTVMSSVRGLGYVDYAIYKADFKITDVTKTPDKPKNSEDVKVKITTNLVIDETKLEKDWKLVDETTIEKTYKNDEKGVNEKVTVYSKDGQFDETTVKITWPEKEEEKKDEEEPKKDEEKEPVKEEEPKKEDEKKPVKEEEPKKDTTTANKNHVQAGAASILPIIVVFAGLTVVTYRKMNK